MRFCNLLPVHEMAPCSSTLDCLNASPDPPCKSPRFQPTKDQALPCREDPGRLLHRGRRPFFKGDLASQRHPGAREDARGANREDPKGAKGHKPIYQGRGRGLRPHSTPATLVWLEENYEIADGVCIPRNTLYQHYVDFCSWQGLHPVNAASFGKVTFGFLRLFVLVLVRFDETNERQNLFVLGSFCSQNESRKAFNQRIKVVQNLVLFCF